jgi:elongation factor Ts
MSVDAKTVKALRDKTGAPMMDCKEALSQTGGDIEKATVYLREKGMASAGKKAGRSTQDGKIISYIHPGDKLGVLVEINCETDFVAKGDEFGEFAKDIAMHIAAANPRFLTSEDVPESVLDEERAIYRTQALNENKPEKIVDKIVEGRLGKFYTECCLMDQPFVKNDKMTISEYVKSAVAKFGENIKIARFARFRIGE